MGVTYKLRQEVIDLIVQSKKASPSLSCRALTGIVREAFQIEVSKSSVNAVIKEYALSNPVGRHRADGTMKPARAPRNFLIPPEKKEQLLARVAPFLPEIAGAAPVAPIVPAAPVTPVSLTAPTVRTQRSLWDTDDSPAFENGGFVLVRAMMQNVFRRPVIGKVLAAGAGMSPDEAERLEAAVFLEAMGASSVGELYAKDLSALWVMFGLSTSAGCELMDRFLGKNFDLPALCMALDVELAAGLTRGDFFKCTSDTGRNFYFSADLSMFMKEPGAGQPCPVFKAIEGAVDAIFSRRWPLVFDVEELDLQAEELFLLLAGQTRDRLDKVELWNNKAGKIWGRTAAVGQKIRFIARTKGIEDVLSKVEFDTIDDPQECYDAELVVKYRLMEGKLLQGNEPGKAWRAIVVQREGALEKEVLVTNISVEDAAIDKIFKAYLQHRHISHVSHDSVGYNSHKSQDSHISQTIHGLLSSIYIIFENMVHQSLFPDILATESVSRLFKMPAKIKEHCGNVHIRLVPGPETTDLAALVKAVDLANGLCMKDRLGRRLFFSLEPAIK